jgi:hypothetical protein
MPKFRKKPVEIEAAKWTGKNQGALMQWVERMGGRAHWRFDGDDLYIKTLEGEMHAAKGDWIIRGVKGEYYPCKPDIFESTYDFVGA